MEAQDIVGSRYPENHPSPMADNAPHRGSWTAKRSNNFETRKGNITSTPLQKRTRMDCSAVDSCIKGAANKVEFIDRTSYSSDDEDEDDVIGALIYNSSLTAQTRATKKTRDQAKPALLSAQTKNYQKQNYIAKAGMILEQMEVEEEDKTCWS